MTACIPYDQYLRLHDNKIYSYHLRKVTRYLKYIKLNSIKELIGHRGNRILYSLEGYFTKDEFIN